MIALMAARIGPIAAQDASPAVAGERVTLAEPSACLVEPRGPVEDFWPATPDPFGSVESQADLPRGEPADQALVVIVVGVERELAAWVNDADIARVAALLTRASAAAFLAIAASFERDPDPNDIRLTPLSIRDVRVLADGHLGGSSSGSSKATGIGRAPDRRSRNSRPTSTSTKK